MLPAGGGTLVVTGTVKNATTCRLELLSRQSFSVVYSHNPKGCAGGGYSARVTIGPNPSAVRRTVAFALVARNATSSFTGRFYVALAPRLHVAIESARADPSSLPAGGGRVEVTGTVTHATSCQLELLSNQSFPVVYSHNPTTSCASGNYLAHVTIGPNPSPISRTVAFALVARNSTSSFIGRFYVLLEAPPLPTTTVAPTTTTVPGPTTTVPSTSVTPQSGGESWNWSGYAVTNGPYTGVTGTFTVPVINSTGSCGEDASEWVGIDGFSSNGSDINLIQAGIDENTVNLSTGACTPGTYYIQPWWEILPADETPITNWNGGLKATVSPGDQVSISLTQASVGLWDITVTDVTTQQSFTKDENYGGQGESAEWIVEAPTNLGVCGRGVDPSQSEGICPLAPYTPEVTFTNLSVDGNTSDLYDIVMSQDSSGDPLSVPSPVPTLSALFADGFTVSYTASGASSDAVDYNPKNSERANLRRSQFG
jgi:hypothetical protein